ncbi:MAG: hypothetical protein ACRDSN_07825, partial [Pseudonocardiaceae bacterium]
EPEVAAGGSSAAAVGADLASRYGDVRDTAELLAELLGDELALTGAGQLGGADPATLGRLVAAARQWGIAPDPAGATATNGGQPPHPLVFTAGRAAALLEERLAAAPAATAAATLPRPELTDALARLVSPTGQLAILSRLPLTDLPTLQRAAGGTGVTPLDTAWLPVVAAVREALARLELHQLTAGSAHGAGPALSPWSSKPADPWQQVASDDSRLVVAYTAATLDLAALPASATVAAGVLDRFTETVPAEAQSTSAVFGFDAPAARAPQAILLAVPPDLAKPWDDETLRDVVLETRELAHARVARPAELDEAARAVLPSVLLPAGGNTGVTLDPRQA